MWYNSVTLINGASINSAIGRKTLLNSLRSFQADGLQWSWKQHSAVNKTSWYPKLHRYICHVTHIHISFSEFRHFRYGDFHYKDKTVARPSHLYNGNPYIDTAPWLISSLTRNQLELRIVNSYNVWVALLLFWLGWPKCRNKQAIYIDLLVVVPVLQHIWLVQWEQ